MLLLCFSLICSPILFWKHLVMQRLLETITRGGMIYCFKNILICIMQILYDTIYLLGFHSYVYIIFAVVLVSLWRFNLTRWGEFQELLSELICWKDHVFARCLILREIITVSTCFVLHHQR